MAEFDIDRFLQKSGAVQIDDLDWDEARRVGITDIEARLLRYMADTETHTILYLRDILAGYTARDPEITAFLSVWVYEELWHGRAIDMMLTAAGRPVPKERYTEVTLSASIREMVEATLASGAAYFTPKFVGTHMAWGAIQELTAAAAYLALARRTANGPLATLCRRMAKQERKHFAFYYQQAEKRLAESKLARVLARVAIGQFWTPVGSGVGHMDNLSFIAAHLFKDDEDWTAIVEAEKTTQALPGMGWFTMLTDQVKVLIADYEARFGDPGEWAPRGRIAEVADAVA